ncbi:hypothetical protein NDU88_007822 [Pleurodeles waltl]|uniref:Uncharacterized protein n=1 Tax=Pleurodeles waltl TaxID=8319 RepID=A0AAV7U1P7_PLEWA|nr:hypothetical protein NDU88_007822 [Pleurodeles waltl]
MSLRHGGILAWQPGAQQNAPSRTSRRPRSRDFGSPLTVLCQQADADILHVFRCCPAAAKLWTADSDTVTPKPLHDRGRITRTFNRSPTALALNHFIDLPLLRARRVIAMHWKAQVSPDIRHWCASPLKRGKAVALRREEVRGLRLLIIAGAWEPLLQARHAYKEG